MVFSSNTTSETFVLDKTNAKLMQWHKEERKQDNMLRHPADGSQGRKVDRTFPTFANDTRNIRFGLSTDGMNLSVSRAVAIVPGL